MMIRSGMIRLIAVKALFPTKLEMNNPSTTPYIRVNTIMTTDGSTKRKSFL